MKSDGGGCGRKGGRHFKWTSSEGVGGAGRLQSGGGWGASTPLPPPSTLLPPHPRTANKARGRTLLCGICFSFSSSLEKAKLSLTPHVLWKRRGGKRGAANPCILTPGGSAGSSPDNPERGRGQIEHHGPLCGGKGIHQQSAGSARDEVPSPGRRDGTALIDALTLN